MRLVYAHRIFMAPIDFVMQSFRQKPYRILANAQQAEFVDKKFEP